MKTTKMILAVMLLMVASVATATNIPLSVGTYLTTSESVTTGSINNNDGGNLGGIQNGATATFTLTNASAQAMVLTFKTGNNNSSNPKVTVTMNDGSSDFFTKENIAIENTGAWDPKTKHFLYISSVPAGTISLTFSFANSGSYVCNLGSIGLYAISSLDQIPSSTALTLTDGEHSGVSVGGDGSVGYIENGKYSIYTAYNTEDAYLTMKMDVTKHTGGQVQVTVTDVATSVSTTSQVFEVPVSGEDKEFELSAPITAGVKNIRLDYIKDGSGYIMNYSNLRFVKRAEYDPLAVLTISSLTIDGEVAASAVLSGVNDNEDSYTLTGNIYTAMPVITAMFNNGDPVTVTPSLSGSDATYTLTGEDFESTLIIEGVHVYTPAGSEKTVDIKANAGTIDGETWSNGIYSVVANRDHGAYNECFKDKGTTYTLSVPSDIVVKQLVLKDIRNNYQPKGAYVSGASSAGATAYVPTKNQIYHADEGGAHDVLINIDGHSAGQDVVFNLAYTGSDIGEIFFWIQLTTLGVDPGTDPISTAQTATISDNDAVVAVTFDREIANDVTASIAGQTVKAKGGSSVLYFPVWDLPYSSNNTLTIAAGAATDNYSRSNASAIEIAVNIPAKAAVIPAVYDYVVSNVSEFTAAVAAVNSSNTSALSARKTIFIKNGNYNLGSEVGTGKSLVQLSCYNVSLIGESRDGVILYGETDGISNPVLNLRDKSGFYLQDLTVKNTHDYGNGLFNGGVAVAVYGGDKTIMKNVRMLSNQDTQVTGHRAYFEDCAIHGTVDFICGGGDNFYYHTDLVLENRGGNCITAPSTSSAHQWGYVFDHCTIKGVDATAAATNAGSYSLGRPWQNEPRAYFLNTDMQVLCQATGWTNMSAALISHFYEYGTTHDGSAVDLSTRQKPSTSPNEYTPVLTAQEAAEFTVHNVLGGTDAWDAQADAAQVAAPQNISAKARTLKWNAVPDALLYVIFKDGAYVANTTATTYDVAEDGVYTVKAANKFGGLGAASAAVTISTGTYVRAFANSYLNTLCFPYQINTYTGATFYTLQYKEVENEVVTNIVLDEVEADAPLAAGTPYFYVPNEGEDELVCEYSGEPLENPLSAINGVQGIFASQFVPENDYVTYQGQIRKVGDNVTLHEYRAYIHMANVSDVPTPVMAGRKRLSIRNADAPQNTEGVENVQSDKLQGAKMIRNGQLFIIRDGRTYNALGQLVD